jgi:ribosomal protein S12 methylthiotransferase accessory factor
MSDTSRAQVLELCAQALSGEQPPEQLPAPVRAMLKALEYDIRGEPAFHQADPRHRARLLLAAARFERLFQLRSPDAPGLIFFGAEVDPSGIVPGGAGQRRLPSSGAGLTFRAAFEGCAGEGVELLSQFEHQADEVLHESDEVIARRCPDDTEAVFPAELCLRRAAGRPPPWPLSIGCAAGPSPEAAMMHGLLELIERDAAALWWRGGMRGHAVPLDSEAARRATATLARARGASRRRKSWLLDITTDLGIPCIAAMSVDGTGKGFACGLAARLTMADAAVSAILEMCQMELAHYVVDAKRRESGDAALNRLDLAHLRRGAELDPARCALLHPLPPRPCPAPAFAGPDAPLAALVSHLASKGIETFTIDLTRAAFGIPVARMICPALEKEPSERAGDRLCAAIQQTGGGRAHTGGVPLM